MNRRVSVLCAVAAVGVFLVFAWSGLALADDKEIDQKNYKNTKAYQEFLAKKNSPHEDAAPPEQGTLHWLEEWGTTIQIGSAVLLIGAIVFIVVLRRSRPSQAKDGSKPLLPPSAGGTADPGQPR